MEYERCILPLESEARHRLDTLCRMLNRDCPLGHKYSVVDVKNSDNEKCTVILNETENREALNEIQWMNVVNDIKPLHVIEKEIFNSSFYRFKLL